MIRLDSPSITREIAGEKGLAVDETTFTRLMQAQKQRARAARADISGWSDNSKSKLHDLPKTVFTGYTDYRSPAKVLAIFVDDEAADMVSEGTCTVVLDRTPFYGERYYLYPK